MNHIEEFLLENVYQESTRKGYAYLLNKVFAWMDSSDLTFDNITAAQVRAWMNSQKWGKNYQYVLSCALRSFTAWKYGTSHPLMRLRVAKGKPSPQRTLDQDQIETLMHLLDDGTAKGVRDRAIVALLLDSGMRSFEICGLQMKYIKIDKCCLEVFTKGGVWQHKVFSKQTADMLTTWLEIRGGIAGPRVETVFVGVGGSTPGGPITANGLRAIFQQLSERVGFRLSPHDFRRTMAVMATQKGAPTRIVQLQGGWSDVRMVERYTQTMKPEDFKPYFPVSMLDLKG